MSAICSTFAQGSFPITKRSYQSQHGTPFRLLSFAPSTETASQQTTGPGSQPYPDWTLLDLLYVPSTLTPYGGAYHASTNLTYFGTFGGATSGRINPNGAVIYTTNVTVPQPNVSRTLPMQAVFDGIKVNQQITGSGTHSDWSGGTTLTSNDADTLAKAVENYIRTSEIWRFSHALRDMQYPRDRRLSSRTYNQSNAQRPCPAKLWVP